MTYNGICLTKDILIDKSVFLSKEHAGGQDVLTQEGVDLFRHRVQRECAQQQRKQTLWYLLCICYTSYSCFLVQYSAQILNCHFLGGRGSRVEGSSMTSLLRRSSFHNLIVSTTLLVAYNI